jgi:short-subunit dehydrogenase
LGELASTLAQRYPVQLRTLVLDLSVPEDVGTLLDEAQRLELGLVVYNAAASPVGAFLQQDEARLDKVLQTNCQTPSVVLRRLLPAMQARRRGGVVLMSSMAGFQGAEQLVAYAASKAYLRVLAEGLWAELRPHGVHVMACVAGATRTPGYLASLEAGKRSPGELEPAEVVQSALEALGTGPVHVPGMTNRAAARFLSLLPKRWSVALFSSNTRKLRSERS